MVYMVGLKSHNGVVSCLLRAQGTEKSKAIWREQVTVCMMR
jgi:hypothetical protein